MMAKWARGVPDVAGDADPHTGYTIEYQGTLEEGVGGTSAVAPLWAGFTALINQSMGNSIGYINPKLYNNYDKLKDSALKEITVGSNGFDGITKGYNAGPDWNPCTGLGTPKGVALLQILPAL